MRIVVQRVSRARISVEDEVVAEIRQGLLVLLGIAKSDVPADAEFLAKKISKLRIFEDGAGKMNLAVNQIGGEVLVVSQFTLYADTSRGARPSSLVHRGRTR
jgi:D-tyrosyl-tRNA(Tyr) deacylase